MPPKQKPMAATRRRVGLGLAEQHVQPCLPERPGLDRITHERPEAGHHLIHRHGLAPTVVVEGKRHVAEAGEPQRALLGVVVEARTLVADQHPWAGALQLIVDRQLTDELQALGLVLDVLDAHDLPLSSAQGYHAGGRARESGGRPGSAIDLTVKCRQP